MAIRPSVTGFAGIPKKIAEIADDNSAALLVLIITIIVVGVVLYVRENAEPGPAGK